MDKDQTVGICALIAIAAALAFGVGLIAGCKLARAIERQDAIKAGAGLYVVDSSTGDVTFRYGFASEGRRP